MTTTPPGPREQLDALLDAVAFDSAGVKIGPVRQVYVDDQSGKATFAGVATGLFSADAIVPLHGARLLDGELHVDHTRAAVRDSPRPDHTEDALTPDQELELLEHYGVEVPARAPEPAAKAAPAVRLDRAASASITSRLFIGLPFGVGEGLRVTGPLHPCRPSAVRSPCGRTARTSRA